jgi:hypothetical protein
MLYVMLDGRLGNHLFQIAAAYTLDQNVTLCVKHPAAKAYFESCRESVFYRRFQVVERVPPNASIYREPAFSYAAVPYRDGEDLVLDGCFQSERYLNRASVLDLFAVPPDLKDEIVRKHGHWLRLPNVTGIHVRRGDYLRAPHRHPFVGWRYYRDAIDCIGSDKPFIVCSDDIAWCKKTFRSGNFYFVEGSDAVTDLYIQSLCQNNIMSNSSFSWWGAWLNQNPAKVVIAPARWFGLATRHHDCSDLYPTPCVKIRNRYTCSQYVHALYLMLRSAIGVFYRAHAGGK